MSDSLSLKLQAIITPASGDQYDPFEGGLQDDITFTKKAVFEIEATAGGQACFQSGQFASLKLVVIKNLDAAIDVTADWLDTDANAPPQRIPPGRTLVIPDCVPAAASWVNLTSDSGTPMCKVWAYGD